MQFIKNKNFLLGLGIGCGCAHVLPAIGFFACFGFWMVWNFLHPHTVVEYNETRVSEMHDYILGTWCIAEPYYYNSEMENWESVRLIFYKDGRCEISNPTLFLTNRFDSRDQKPEWTSKTFEGKWDIRPFDHGEHPNLGVYVDFKPFFDIPAVVWEIEKNEKVELQLKMLSPIIFANDDFIRWRKITDAESVSQPSVLKVSIPVTPSFLRTEICR